MGDWVIPAIVIAAVFLMIGNYSTLQKNAKTPLRKKNLNDLKETIPRNKKSEHKMPTVPTKTKAYKSKQESD